MIMTLLPEPDPRSLPTSATEEFTPQQVKRVREVLYGDEGDPAEELAFAAKYRIRFGARWGPLTFERLAEVARQQAPHHTGSVTTVPQDRISFSLEPRIGKEPGPVVEPYGGTDDPWDDTLFALNALGLSKHALAREVLPLYLTSPTPRERWTSALWLGQMRDERALPALVRMLTEFLPPDQVRDPDGDIVFWYVERQLHVAPFIWQMGDRRTAVALRQALLAALAVEQAIPQPSGPEPEWPVPGSEWAERLSPPYQQRFTGSDALQMYESECQPWITYQHQLVYGLGRLGAFGALMGVEAPVGVYGGSWENSPDSDDPDTWDTWVRTNAAAEAHADRFRSYLWRVEACCGYLEPTFHQAIGAMSPSRYHVDVYAFREIPEFAQAVEHLLEEQFGLEPEERRQAMQDYEEAHCLTETIRYYGWVRRQAAADQSG